MTIGVFFGSRSPEHDISIITGQLIIAGLKKLGFTVVPVYLDKQGRWLLGAELGELKSFTAGKIDLDKFQHYVLDLEQSRNKLVFKKKGLGGPIVAVDLAFPALHGSNGEDGTIQGLFEIFNMPYVGCDVASSAITMNKNLAKLMFKAAGIPTPEFKNYSKKQWDESRNAVLDDVEKTIGFPVVVKPTLLGSSIGIVKAGNPTELEQGLETGFYYGNQVLVEDCVENLMDITCAVLGNETPQASLLQESVIGDEVLSFSDKYLNDGGTQLGKSQNSMVIPARVDDNFTKQIQQTAIQAFQALGCSGIARVDFLYDKLAKNFFVSEINTLPGTLYHHLWAKSGIELDELLTRLIQLAQDAYTEKNCYATVFESDLLKMAGSVKLQTKLHNKQD